MSSQLYTSIDPRQFRTACGRFATGITVVTTEYEGQVHGMTANGFVSVSLEPPLILISVAHKAHLHKVLPQSGRYGVSILDEGQEKLSQHFSGRPIEDLSIAWIEVANAPLIDGALAHLVARVVDAHPAGDHTLYIGEVEYLHYQEGRPLLYYGGKYNQLKPD